MQRPQSPQSRLCGTIKREQRPLNILHSTIPNHSFISRETMSLASATHVLVFPFPAQGHMLPLLDLSHQLALRGLEITVLVTPKNLPILDPLLSTHPNSIRTLVLSFPPHPALPVGAENVKDVGSWANGPIIQTLANLEGEVIQWFESNPSPPRAIISDFFLGYTNRWAKKLNIPRVAFFSSGVFITSVANHVLLDKETICSSADDTVQFIDFPKTPTFAEEHVPEIVRILKTELLENINSWGIISNTFHALEGEYLDHIKHKQIHHGRVYAVGPLSLNSERSKSSSLDSDVDHLVLNWLDECPDSSVLYVCFGSQKLLPRPQMEALALGLQRSKTRFVWVLNSTTVGEEPTWVPGDVFDGKGLVIKGWVPQVEILNHRAVGGFLSHCGWNSLLESVAAGVMVLAWPMEGDQFVNARLLVKERELAVQVCEGENTVPDPDKLARTIAESLAGNKPENERAKLMREKAVEAVKANGSSFKDLDMLAKELRQIGA